MKTFSGLESWPAALPGTTNGGLQNNYLGLPTKGYFFAHGNCATVGVGGHMHADL